ncbi:MAG: Wzz/FepE/Etk N-terminal domain-containing protein [Halioglobus sp.]
MNSSSTSTNTAIDHIDLLPYLNALIQKRWWLVGTTVAAALIAAVLAYNKPYQYQSIAKVAIVDIKDPGGVSPDDRRASEVLTLVEHGFVMGKTRDNYNAVMRAKLTSRDFTMEFIERSDIYQHFYSQHWDAEEQSWIGDFTPDRGQAFTRFRDEVRTITHDELTDIVSVGMQWPDAVVARDWTNDYITAFNEYIRTRTLREVESKLEYLNSELRRSDVLEIQQSLYRLIEAQTAIAMLANAREEYALEIIDPAARAYKSFNMSRKARVILAAIAGLLVSVFAVLGTVLAMSMLTTLKAYQAATLTAPTSNQERDS